MASLVNSAHFFHLNIGVGDCTIVVELDAKKNPQTLVLIDGGTFHDGAAVIRNWMTNYAPGLYALFSDRTVKPSFARIVITHWDMDHYGGVSDFLLYDVKRQYDQLTESGQTPEQAVQNVKSPFLQYDGGSGVVTSTLYVPYLLKKDEPTMADTAAKDCFFRYTLNADSNADNEHIDFNIGSQSDKIIVPKFCKVKHGWKALGGLNIFTNTQPTKSFFTPVELAAVSQLADGRARAGLYIVSAARMTYTTAKSSPPASSSSSKKALFTGSLAAVSEAAMIFDQSIQTTDSSALNKGTFAPFFKPSLKIVDRPTNLDDQGHASNAASIICILVYPPCAPAPNGKVSYYLAGDSLWDTEELLAAWINQPITCLKLSHHGSAYSSPAVLFKTYQPRNVVISAGRAHFHPAWQLLFYLYAYAINSKEDKFVHLTSYPCWMVYREDGAVAGIDPTDFLAGGSDQTVKFQKDLEEAMGSDRFQMWKKEFAKANGDITAQRRFIVEKMVNGWPIMAYLTPENKVPDQANESHVTIVKPNQAVVWVIRQSDLNDTSIQDGYGWVRVEDQSNIPAALKVAGNPVVGTPPHFKFIRRNPTRSSPDASSSLSTTTVTGLGLQSINASSSSSSNAMAIDNGSNKAFFATTAPLKAALSIAAASDDDSDDMVTLDVQGSGYYVCSTEIAVPQGTPASQYTKLASTDILNDFLLSLHTGILSIAGKPDAAGKALISGTNTVDDEMLQWLNTAFAASSMIAYATAADTVSKFTITISKLNGLVFSTEKVPESFFPASVQPSGFGYVHDSNMLVFGLDTSSVSANQTWNLADLLTYMQLDPRYLSGLAGLVGLDLDTSATAKNMLWFWPDSNYLAAIRLQFVLKDMTALQSWMTTCFQGQITLSQATVVLKKSVRWIWSDGNGLADPDPDFIVSATFSSPKLGSSITGHLLPTSDSTTLILEPTDGSLGGILDWLFVIVGAPFKGKYVTDWLPSETNSTTVRQIQLKSSNNKLVMFEVTIEMEVGFGKPDSGSRVAFLMTYTWQSTAPTHKFTGTLWCPITMDPSIMKGIGAWILPSTESYSILVPNTPHLTREIHLSNLIPDNFSILSPPKELNLIVGGLTLELGSDGATFTGYLVANDPSPLDPTPVGFRLEMVNLYATHQTGGNTTVRLDATVNLYGTDPTDTAELYASITYQSGTSRWDLLGNIQNLRMSTLLQFFPSTDGSTVMTIMDHIELSTLEIQYSYENGHASSFHIVGAFVFDVVELDMDFTWNPNNGWALTAQLTTAPDADTSLLKMLKSLFKDSSIVDLMPSFVDVPFRRDEATQQGNGLSVTVEKIFSPKKAGTNVPFIIFTASVILGAFRLDVVQVKQISDTKGAPLPPKRVVRASIHSLAFDQTEHIPIVGDLKQPYGELDFVWIHDAASNGLTRLELSAINSVSGISPIMFKDNVPVAKQKDANILLESGSHFIVAGRGPDGGSLVGLDYVFGQPSDVTPAPAAPNPKEFKRRILMAAADTKDDEQPTGTTPANGETSMGKLQQSQGPLTIQNVGLRYADSTLHIFLDAAVKLGPINFTLMGFALALKFSDGINLRNLSGVTPVLNLSGMAIGFNAPPVEVAGLFLNESQPKLVKYVGGVVIMMEPYSFVAVGSYGEHTAGGSSFKSVFLFAMLDGPLIELEIAEIMGISGGFGYNSSVRFPTIAEVQGFPFVSRSFAPPPADPTALLKKFTDEGNWVSDQNGPLWLAAGLKVKAFQCVDVDAVVMFEFDPHFKMAIIAQGRAMMPNEPGMKKEEAFIYAEFGILATVDINGGTLRVEAALTPNSFVLNPACHLGGGFALCYWFAGSGHDGDWVFTVGGYHPAYQVPDHYPRPDRLTILWDLGAGLTVTGQAYFAITPKACMGGGSLSVVLSAGPLGAFFYAFAEFLINYSPFHFTGEVGVSVGVSFTLDLWICTIHISVDVSALLTLYGPPFGGSVYVDFWVFGFTIGFGASDGGSDPLLLSQFYDLLIQMDQKTASAKSIAAPASIASAASADTPKQHILSVVTGRYAGSTHDVHCSETAIWVVRRGGFKFSVQSRFAVSSSKCNNDDSKPSPATNSIYSKPMHLTDSKTGTVDMYIASDLQVTIKQTGSVMSGWTYAPIIKKVPAGLWSPYDPKNDPSSGSDSSSPILNNTDKTIDLMMGLTLQAPPPTLSDDSIKDFNALESMSRDVFEEDEHPNVPSNVQTPSTAWLPAARSGTGSDPAQPWKDVQGTWASPKLSRVAIDSAVSAWANAFGYGSMSAAAPPRASTLADVEVDYMTAPFVSVAA